MHYSELNELKILKVYSNEQSKQIPVFVNPSKKDYEMIMNKSRNGHLRAYLYEDNLYIWDAYMAYHIDLADELGIDNDTAMNLHFFKKGSSAWASGDSDDTDKFLLKNYRVIRRLVGIKQI